MIYICVIGGVVAGLLTVTIFKALTVKNQADFLVAGRKLPWWVLVSTLLCSWIGAGSLFAGAENATRIGFAALWQPAGGWVGSPALCRRVQQRPPCRQMLLHHRVLLLGEAGAGGG